MSAIIAVAAIALMLAAAAIIPLGLPGLWLMVVVTMGLVLAGSLSWAAGLIVAGVVLVAEVSEFLVLKRFGTAYGGSRRAFWGALAGGMLGLFVGVPVPIVGSVITAFLGTFLGAGIVTFVETLSLERSARVGWGVLLARTAAVALKLGTAISVIAFVAITLFFRS
ncbi:MAG: DUF456 domain-containing protein [Gemmatimonadota bacterium]